MDPSGKYLLGVGKLSPNLSAYQIDARTAR
jgi:hypothetical protein